MAVNPKKMPKRALAKLNTIICDLQDWADRYGVNIETIIARLHEERMDLEDDE